MTLPVEDLAFEVHLSGPQVAVRITHVPTGLVATGVSESLGQWRVKQQVLAELERMVMVGRRLTAADPEPPMGSVVLDDCGVTWENDGYRPCCWVRPDLVAQEIHDPETWTKIAGNYGPVTVTQWGGCSD